MDYKNTLNLPKTDFPMKADLPNKEPQILQRWSNLYEKILSIRKGAKKFVLHDGPPYANGNIHIGHALNKILKDVINKYSLMTGNLIDYVPGWDCHGLPIERQVEKELKEKGKRKEDIPKVEFRKLCREYALRFVNIQKEEFIRLGILGDWENPYITMDPSYEAEEIRELGRFFKKGLVYRSKKPVYWCIYDSTAEAEAEVEYRERKDPSIFVMFPLQDEDAHLLIWTTTPWTLPANLGAMVGEDFTYCYYQVDGKVLVIAEERIEEVVRLTGSEGKILKRIKGRDLVGKSYLHPFVRKKSLEGYLRKETLNSLWKVYPSEFVDLSSGTGIVHMAPGHGTEDYIVGGRYGLEPYAPLDDRGRFIEPAPEFIRGLRVFEANERIIEVLEEKGLLFHRDDVVHSYPHCWRCKNPVIFRATHQWFISMEAPVNSKSLREKSLEEIERVKWYPPSGQIRIRSMVEQRPDWCISRQRFWGVPITVFYCRKCSEVIADPEVIENIAKKVEENHGGSDVWFELPAKDLLPDGFRCPKCGGSEFDKEEDILDVWFDSGCSHVPVLRRRGISRADLYLEGSDQHRGWFQASLLESVGSYGEAPYDAVLTHGFTVDEQGRKMSKSLGNVVSPQEIIKEYGADILRLWVVSEDYTEDVKLGKGILKNVTEDYKKIRNTIRFMLANLYDFNPQEDSISFEKMHHFDRWVTGKFQELLSVIHSYYTSYTFHRVYHEIRNFCVKTLSSLYLDVVKDRLYVLSPADPLRRSAQTALYEIVRGLVASIAPFLSFTAEEAWNHLRKIDPTLPESVFLWEIPQPDSKRLDKELEDSYNFLLSLREDVMKCLEEARQRKIINHPYEAKVFINGKGIKEKLSEFEDYLPYFFTVSQLEFGEGGEVSLKAESKEGLAIGVGKAEGKKCPRCWLYYPEDQFKGDVCERCCTVLEGKEI